MHDASKLLEQLGTMLWFLEALFVGPRLHILDASGDGIAVDKHEITRIQNTFKRSANKRGEWCLEEDTRGSQGG
jgi:hypothetical protein